jgi:glucose-6-phosphate 1-dehydrogenase
LAQQVIWPKKKIIPALFALYERGQLPQGSSIVAYSRRPWTDAQYHDFVREKSFNNQTTQHIENFLKIIVHVRGEFNEAAGFASLKEYLSTTHPHPDQQHFFHLAIQPDHYIDVIQNLGQLNLQAIGKPRLIIEKPFGFDGSTAAELEKVCRTYFDEHHIFRIDHYLGKYGLHHLWNTRFTDAALEAHIENELVAVEARIFERRGIEGRGAFFDSVGALRDVGQNHILEMVAVALAEIDGPEARNAGEVQSLPSEETRTEVLVKVGAARVLAEAKVWRGQYDTYAQDMQGVQANGQPSQTASTSQANGEHMSQTETYVKAALSLDILGQKNISIIIETGKGLDANSAEIVYVFKNGERRAFDMQWDGRQSGERADAYTTVLQQAFSGNQHYFVGFDEVMALWNITTPLHEKMQKAPLVIYAKNSYPKV